MESTPSNGGKEYLELPASVKEGSWWLQSIARSNVAMVIEVEGPHLPERATPGAPSSGELTGALKDALALRLLEVKHIMAEHGVRLPLVAILRRAGGGDPSLPSEEQSEAWGRDQDWHRGEFILVSSDAESVEKRRASVLAPELPELEALPADAAVGEESYLDAIDDLGGWSGRVKSVFEALRQDPAGEEAPRRTLAALGEDFERDVLASIDRLGRGEQP